MRPLLLGLFALWYSAAPSQATVLESPLPGAMLSGLGFISGWKCDAGHLTVRFNNGPALPLLYGNERGDTRGVCGDAGNGFIAQMNWSLLGNGTHTAVAYDDEVEFARSTFTVRRFQDEFVTGASTTVSTQDFPTPGETAVFTWHQATQHLELVDTFGTSTSNDPPDCTGWTTGSGSNAYDSAASIQACLEAGADPYARDAEGNTPLHHVAHNYPDAGRKASLLLAAGADPNARNNQGKTPLHRVLRYRDPFDFEFVVVLLEGGADPNARDLEGNSSFHLVYYSRQEDMERAFLQAGADPNLLDGSSRPYSCNTFECLAMKRYRATP